MFAPYKKSQIRDFAQTSLSFIGSFTDSERNRHRLDFMRAVSLLPPWQQVLMIENGGTNVATTKEVIRNILESDKPDYFGVFVPDAQQVKTGPTEVFNSVNGIYWAVDGGANVLATLYHEQGHRIDYLISERFYPKAKEHYFSDNSPEWRTALIEQMALSNRVKMRGNIETVSSTGKQKAAYLRVYEMDMDDSVPLYPGYTRLPDHLKEYEDKSDHGMEAFAEMNAHYCMMYAKTKGRDFTVDRKLEEHFPALWPVFRDSVMNKAQEFAQELLIRRDRGVAPPRP